MKASKARKIAIEACSNQIGELIEIIKTESERGDTSYQSSNLKEGAVDWLEDNGYKLDIIQLYSYGNEKDKIVKISW